MNFKNSRAPFNSSLFLIFLQALGIELESAAATPAFQTASSAVGSVRPSGRWKEELSDQGFFVFAAHIEKGLAQRGAKAIQSRVQHVLKLYGVKDARNVGSSLRLAAKHFGKSPEGWTGAAFGGFDKRGWHISVGNGRMFQDWDHPAILSIREATRSIASDWHGVPGDALRGHPESCSMKVPGCPPLAAHLDKARRGTLQIVIALSKTTGIVWPGSHKLVIGKKKKHKKEKDYYELEEKDFRLLKTKGCSEKTVDLDVGDVLVFMGGVMVHGSPGLCVGEAPRIMTYAHWSVEDGPGSAEGSGNAG